MTCNLNNFAKVSLLAFSLMISSASAMAQDGTIYPLAAPEEPNAIALGTGGVKDQRVLGGDHRIGCLQLREGPLFAGELDGGN